LVYFYRVIGILPMVFQRHAPPADAN